MPSQSRAVVSHARLVGRYLWKQVQWEMRRPLTTSLQMERTMSLPQSGLAVFGFVLLICAIHSFWGRRRRKEERVSHLKQPLYCLRVKALHTNRSYSSDSLVFMKFSAQVSRLKAVFTECMNCTFKLYIIVKMQFSSFLSFLLLLLAGDIELNPGPLSSKCLA